MASYRELQGQGQAELDDARVAPEERSRRRNAAAMAWVREQFPQHEWCAAFNAALALASPHRLGRRPTVAEVRGYPQFELLMRHAATSGEGVAG